MNATNILYKLFIILFIIIFGDFIKLLFQSIKYFIDLIEKIWNQEWNYSSTFIICYTHYIVSKII